MATSWPSRPSASRVRTSPIGAGAGQRDRLFDEHVLAGGDRLQHLGLVLAVRRRQHHCIDVRVRHDRPVAVGKRHTGLATERLGARTRARMGEDETDVVALALHRTHERAAPAAEPDDCCANHALLRKTAARRERRRENYHRHLPVSTCGG
jgi:hypothetical protein